MKNRLAVLFLVLIVTQSCSVDTPEKYFNATTLDVNKYSSLGSKDFQYMMESHSQNALFAVVDGKIVTPSTYEAHIRTYKIVTLEKDIKEIKKLKPTEETKEMINASLEVFNFVKSKYETDYIKLAKLLDNKEDKEKIDAAILKFEEQNLGELNKKLQALFDIALPYAKKNGMDVKFY